MARGYAMTFRSPLRAAPELAFPKTDKEKEMEEKDKSKDKDKDKKPKAPAVEASPATPAVAEVDLGELVDKWRDGRASSAEVDEIKNVLFRMYPKKPVAPRPQAAQASAPKE